MNEGIDPIWESRKPTKAEAMELVKQAEVALFEAQLAEAEARVAIAKHEIARCRGECEFSREGILTLASALEGALYHRELVTQDYRDALRRFRYAED